MGGYYKSESVKVDEEEMINNYNGNLTYSIPVYQAKDEGDLYFNLSLNYNGSINYQVFTATKNYVQFNSLPRYNITAPGWILSVNGMAVQMFNFERNFFTAPKNSSQINIDNDDIHMLAVGYQITDNLRFATSGYKDVINIMRGDGSVINLQNLSGSCNNENSQIDSIKYHNGSFHIINTFNARSWLTSSLSTEDKFSYALDYFYNGNVKAQRLMGSYRLNYSGEQREVSSTFRYDNSNRLIQAGKTNPKVYSPEETFSYDKDGNILTLTRDYSGDNFSYQYYEGTNRLRSIDGGVTQHYAYDYNGNLISDSRRNITSIKYDNRNLPTEIIISSVFMAKSYKIEYKYDESGNRFRKKVYENEAMSGESPIGWILIKDEVYVRDVSGKEIAVYENSTLDYYNIWGNGLEGKIKRDERGNLKYYYYYKDHLGSVRAVMESDLGTIVQAQDYDAWGDIFRSYSSDDISQNKFTSKERDAETGYDYFGARYYDSRIGNWLSPDPLSEKHIGWSPYNYVLRNPYMLIDPDGRQLNVIGGTQNERNDFLDYLDINGLSFDPKNLNRVIYNGSNDEYDPTTSLIISLIQGNLTSTANGSIGYTVELNAELKDKSYFTEDGKTIYFPAEGYGGNIVDENNHKVIGRQYFHLPSIEKMDRYGIYDEQDVLKHAITEGAIGAKERLIYDLAHPKAYPLKLGPWFENLPEKITNSSVHSLKFKYKYPHDGKDYETIFDYDLTTGK